MFTIQTVRDLQWADEEHTVFTCFVKYAEFPVEHPAGVNATDPYAHIHELWVKGIAGEYGSIAEYVPIPQPAPVENQPPVQGAQTL